MPIKKVGKAEKERQEKKTPPLKWSRKGYVIVYTGLTRKEALQRAKEHRTLGYNSRAIRVKRNSDVYCTMRRDSTKSLKRKERQRKRL